MNGNRYYGVRVEGAKYGVSFGSALAIAISYTTSHSILWAIIDGILGWHRHVERVFDPSRKDHHWGRRKLARDR